MRSGIAGGFPFNRKPARSVFWPGYAGSGQFEITRPTPVSRRSSPLSTAYGGRWNGLHPRGPQVPWFPRSPGRPGLLSAPLAGRVMLHRNTGRTLAAVAGGRSSDGSGSPASEDVRGRPVLFPPSASRPPPSTAFRPWLATLSTCRSASAQT